MDPDGLYDLLLDAATAPRLEALAASGQATLADLKGPARRQRLIEALQDLLPALLDEALPEGEPDAKATAELHLMNRLLASLRPAAPVTHWAEPLRLLQSLHRHRPPVAAPALPLSIPWLFAAGQSDPSLLSELRKEMASADQVDMLVSFITWSGVRRILDVLQELTALGADGLPKVRLRVLTTTYIGATELRAVEALAGLPGVELRISLDGRRTRLHAKAWIMQRRSGYGTAFVGSANLTGAALMGGLEWTVRFTQNGQRELFESARAHFETLWHDPEFLAYDPDNPEHPARLQAALTEEGRHGTPQASRTWFDLQPKAYQARMLEQLASERRHHRTRNLLVAATGTGKTVVAAFDYRQLAQAAGGLPRLLFVAHRKEILLQARETYRHVLHLADFGELLFDSQQPVAFNHVFASIQSVASSGLVARLGADHWHVVVIDECHHITAKAFDAFARAIRPAYLLGLTATPERADGVSIDPYFDARPDGAPAVALRLWEALDDQLLAPFEYYGITDPTDFTGIHWDQPGLEVAELGRILNGNHLRARLVIDAFERFAAAPHRTRTLGFCVSVAHAEFMARQFQEAGYRALAVTGGTDAEVRRRLPAQLARGELTVVFTCDLYNEGVDLPEVDTLLLLRPTQSPVLFQQQIGRGLRLAEGKASCLILDFVGRHKVEFRFGRLLQTLTGLPKRQLIAEAEAGFPTLPAGCLLQFDRVSRDQVLKNLRQATALTWRRLTGELRAYLSLSGQRQPAMAAFLRDQGLALGELYREQEPSGWTALRRAAGLPVAAPGPREGWLGKRFTSLLHANDPERLQLWRRAAGADCDLAGLTPLEQRLLLMLAYQVYPDSKDRFDGAEFLRRLQAHPDLAGELAELASWLDETQAIASRPLPEAPDAWPLRLHAAYDIREILAGVGRLNPDRRAILQSGVLALHEEKVELLFVTLDKREGYHAGIAYHDYAISPDRFHWQTQRSAGPDTPGGRRYLEGAASGWGFQLFVREHKEAPYLAMGPLVFERAEGDRPMSIVWVLRVPMPVTLFKQFSILRSS